MGEKALVSNGDREGISKRPYSTALRAQQARSTRERIVQALAGILATDGKYDFTIQQVADRAGLSYQSVYHHFGSREALLEAVSQWYAESVGRPVEREVMAWGDDLSGMVPTFFELLEKHAVMIRANAIIALHLNVRTAGRRRVDERFRQIVCGFAPNLSSEEIHGASATIRLLVSGEAWMILTQQLGLDREAAAENVSWAVSCLIQDLKRKNAEAAAPKDPEGNKK